MIIILELHNNGVTVLIKHFFYCIRDNNRKIYFIMKSYMSIVVWGKTTITRTKVQ